MAHAQMVPPRITPEDYIAGEKAADIRHEFVNGRVFAMAGAKTRHNVVRLNIAGHLNLRVPEPCRVFDGDMNLLIERTNDIRYYYPDIFVSCAADDPDGDARRDAVLVIEVLSESTERTDRYEKFAAYTSLTMMSEYAIVEQKVPALEVFRRRTGWACEAYGPGSVVAFESVGQTMSVDEIYRRINF